jgi:hypothetical protein
MRGLRKENVRLKGYRHRDFSRKASRFGSHHRMEVAVGVGMENGNIPAGMAVAILRFRRHRLERCVSLHRKCLSVTAHFIESGGGDQKKEISDQGLSSRAIQHKNVTIFLVIIQHGGVGRFGIRNWKHTSLVIPVAMRPATSLGFVEFLRQ